MTTQKVTPFVVAGILFVITASLIVEPLQWWEIEKLDELAHLVKKHLFP